MFLSVIKLNRKANYNLMIQIFTIKNINILNIKF